jgi:hypothetical protein
MSSGSVFGFAAVDGQLRDKRSIFIRGCTYARLDVRFLLLDAGHVDSRTKEPQVKNFKPGVVL